MYMEKAQDDGLCYSDISTLIQSVIVSMKNTKQEDRNMYIVIMSKEDPNQRQHEETGQKHANCAKRRPKVHKRPKRTGEKGANFVLAEQQWPLLARCFHSWGKISRLIRETIVVGAAEVLL